jgi:hypothetical protein
MSCPPDLTGILTRMLQMALLRIRASCWSGDAERGAIEADHAHNIPGLIADFREELLAYYWNVERSSYLSRIGESQDEGWQELWDELRPYVIAAESAESFGLPTAIENAGPSHSEVRRS